MACVTPRPGNLASTILRARLPAKPNVAVLYNGSSMLQSKAQTRANTRLGGSDMAYKDKEHARSRARERYKEQMQDPEFRKRRRVKSAAYMRDYYKRSASYRKRARQQNKHWREQNKEWSNFCFSLNRYNITLDNYHAILEAQGESCAICGACDLALVIDHCHTTNKVRGLLCQACNSGIGQFKDSLDLLDAAKVYVGKHQNISMTSRWI